MTPNQDTELVPTRESAVEKTAPVATVHPSVDIFESENAYLILADVPGVNSEGLELELHDGELTFRGTQVFSELGKPLSTPLQAVRFERRFAIPRTVDAGRVSARLDNGVLHIELPKRDEVKPRRIAVR